MFYKNIRRQFRKKYNWVRVGIPKTHQAKVIAVAAIVWVKRTSSISTYGCQVLFYSRLPLNSPRSLTSNITRNWAKIKHLPQKRNAVACSDNSLIEPSSLMTRHVSCSLTPFLRLMMATTNMTYTRHNLFLNSLLTQNSKIRYSFALRQIRKVWLFFFFESLVLLSMSNDVKKSTFTVLSLLIPVTITTAVITSSV